MNEQERILDEQAAKRTWRRVTNAGPENRGGRRAVEAHLPVGDPDVMYMNDLWRRDVPEEYGVMRGDGHLIGWQQ